MKSRTPLTVFVSLLLPTLAVTQDGLYISNSTDILYSDRAADPARAVSVYHDPNARIVGLAIDIGQGKIFWSDISLVSRGIYVATLGDGGQLSDVTSIVSDDIGEVNGLTVDWVSRHVYWTDTSKRSIELAEYDGSNRRVLTIDGLQSPRGIVADPNSGWLFWNDQGTKKIERSRLDGSGREVIVEQDLVWPNHMVLKDNELYYVDGHHRVLRKCSKNGNNRQDVRSLSGLSSNNPVFGLTSDGSDLFISVWHQGKVLKYNPSSGLTEFINNLGTEPLFGVAYRVNGIQPITANQPCRNGQRNGCSHLCLPIAATTSRCSCPSFGGLTLNADEKNCRTPTNVMFYALAAEGIVGYSDMTAAENDDRYLIGRSLRPVAVAYDPVEQMVYWSDVHESTVHRAHFQGNSHTIFMSSSSHSIGVVDGLVVDSLHRKLYYTNMGEVQVYRNTHAWHKIEFIGLDGEGRKTVVENVGKPRGLHIDLNGGHLYYTDWGSNPAVVRTDLDGSNVEVKQIGLDNPNAVTVIGSNIYVVDSHYKTRAIENYPGDAMDGALYRLSGETWTKIADLHTPFGMTQKSGVLYITDWTHGLVRINNPSGGSPSKTNLQSSVIPAGATPMDLLYSAVSDTLDTSQPCDASACEICVAEPGSGSSCTCDTYTHEIPSGSSDCAVPAKFMLVGDFNSIKLVGLDSQTFQYDSKEEPQVVVEGNSYYSNYVAMAYDAEESTLYFTDVNRGAIFSMVLGQEPELFFEPGHIIDGLDIDTYRDRLFWTAITDSAEGTGMIASMHKNGNNNTYGPVVTGLNRPRAIRLDQSSGKVYWTEWGTNPRVGRASYDVTGNRASSSNVADFIGSTTVSRPNGLDLNTADGILYVGDADQPVIKQCRLDESGCSDINIVGEGPHHIYSVKYARPNQLLLSDWERGAVSLLDIESGYLVDMVTNLMRPTEIVLKPSPAEAAACPSGHGCSGTCQEYPGGYFCRCAAGQVLDDDGKTCISTDAFVELPSERCGSCDNNKVCAAQVGSSSPACRCPAGYRSNSNNRCSACPTGTFKPYAGDDTECRNCPAGSSSSGTGNTECDCSGSNVWDWEDLVCRSNKPGVCPSGLSGVTCSGSCSNDGACSGASKCCAVNGCSGNQCVAPVNTPQGQCVSDGVVYQVGSSFSPSPCVSCTCTLDKSFGDPLYGDAVCASMDCPALSCDDQVTPEGACCPVCGGCDENPIRITNCPERTQTVTLPDSDFRTTLSYEPQHVDTCDRYPNVQPSPERVEVTYSTREQEVSVSVTACSEQDSSDCEQDTCTFTVRVIDDTKPQANCPSRTAIQIGADKDKVNVIIPPPEIEDNVCGKDPFPACTYTLQGGPAVGDYAVGVHRLKYVVTDAANNEDDCTFTYTVERNEQLTCSVPSVNNGAFVCDEAASVTCQLECHSGYDVNIHTTRTCNNGDWDEYFPENIQQLGCTKVQSHKVLTSLTLIGLPCPTYSRDLIAAGVEKVIRDDHLANLEGSDVTVTTEGCENGERNNLKITIWLSLEYTNTDDYAAQEDSLQRVTDAVNDDIVRGGFVLGDGETIDVEEDDIGQEDPVAGCDIGEKSNGTHCVVCPVGTRWTGTVEESECVVCSKNFYQDQEKRDYCKKCPDGGITESNGAPSVAACIAKATETPRPPSTPGSEFPIAVVVGAVAGGVVLIVIIVIVVVCVLRKRGSQPAQKYQKDTHTNPAYDARTGGVKLTELDDEYQELPDGGYLTMAQGDNIYHDIDDTAGAVGAGEKSGYETLDETKRVEQTGDYDKIGRE